MTDFAPEFGAPQASFDGVAEPLFLGVEPIVAGLFVLLLLGVGALAWMMGRREGSAEGPDGAPAEIHKRVLAASNAALSAPSNRLHEKAGALRTAIETFLGPVITVANGLGAKVKALDEAIKGEVKLDDAKPASAPAPKADAAPQPVTVNTITVITPAPPPAPPAPEKPKTRKMDHDEQVEALAKAVRAFHDHWSQAQTRINELKAARAALSRMPPPEPKVHGAGHAEGDDAGSRKMIWER